MKLNISKEWFTLKLSDDESIEIGAGIQSIYDSIGCAELAALELCHQIEKCGCSYDLTEASKMASSLREKIALISTIEISLLSRNNELQD